MRGVGALKGKCACEVRRVSRRGAAAVMAVLLAPVWTCAAYATTAEALSSASLLSSCDSPGFSGASVEMMESKCATCFASTTAGVLS